MVRFYETGVLTHETGRQAGGNGMGLSKDFIESFLMKMVLLSTTRVQATRVTKSWRQRLPTATHVSISSSTTTTSHSGSATTSRCRTRCQTAQYLVV